MFYYICARCNHISNQKIEMKRHLDKKKKCMIKHDFSSFTEEELFRKSLEKHYKLNQIYLLEENTYECPTCHKKFSNKGNLNKHIKCVCTVLCMTNNEPAYISTDTKINLDIKNNPANKYLSEPNDSIQNTTNNIQNIGVQNIIHININQLKGFDQDWDISNFDHQKKGEILLSNSKFTKTLENILKNELNLNVIMDDDKTGIVYNNEKNKYIPMTKKDIIEKSMEKIYNHLKYFYTEIIQNNKDDLSLQSLENELKVLESKYTNFFKLEHAQKIVNSTFSKLYNDKKDEAQHIYYDFIKQSHLLEEY